VVVFPAPFGPRKPRISPSCNEKEIPLTAINSFLGPNNFFRYRSEILQYVAFASAYTKLPGRLTIFENLDIYGRLFGLDSTIRKAKIKEFLSFFGIGKVGFAPCCNR
jgi:hypothetical protein